MNRNLITLAAVAGVLLTVVIGFQIAVSIKGAPPAAPPAAPTAPAAGLPPVGGLPSAAGLPPGEEDATGLRTIEVVLYFSRPDGLGLAPEPRSIFETQALLDRIKQVVAGLIAGPAAGSPLLPVLPAGTPLRDVFLQNDGTLYLDLGQALARDLAAGSQSERLAVGSLVNSLVLNFVEIARVRLLVEGEEIRTLGGHLDLGYPLEADPSLIVPPDLIPFPEPGAGADPAGEAAV